MKLCLSTVRVNSRDFLLEDKGAGRGVCSIRHLCQCAESLLERITQFSYISLTVLAGGHVRIDPHPELREAYSCSSFLKPRSLVLAANTFKPHRYGSFVFEVARDPAADPSAHPQLRHVQQTVLSIIHLGRQR